MGISLPIGFDRISWKLLQYLVFDPSYTTEVAYRLASIGLVGNTPTLKPTHLELIPSLPIGFDRISWKHQNVHRLNHVHLTMLTDWLRSD